MKKDIYKLNNKVVVQDDQDFSKYTNFINIPNDIV